MAAKSAQRPDSISDDAFEIARIEAGIPKRNVDYTSKTLPPELGRQFELDHVSYNKGCYTGQEVLMRIHSRGHTNRTWMGVILEGQVEVGATISHESREDAGVITSTALSPEFGYIATAMLRREVAKPDTKISVKGVAGRCMLLPIRAL